MSQGVRQGKQFLYSELIEFENLSKKGGAYNEMVVLFFDKTHGVHAEAFRMESSSRVIIEVRRSGKFTLLRMFQDEFIETGVYGESIFSINFEDIRFEELLEIIAPMIISSKR